MDAESQELGFVNQLTENVNYRQDQKELIQKATCVAGDDALTALQYIITSLLHNGNKNIEFELVVCFSNEQNSVIDLPIIETKPPDELGFCVSWGDGKVTHNDTCHEYDVSICKEYVIKIFGLGIAKFGLIRSYDANYVGFTKVISFGNLGHNFTSLKSAFYDCNYLTSVPDVIPSSITDISFMFYNCKQFNQSINSWNTKNIKHMLSVFRGCEKFNQPLNLWDTSSVTDMESMFNGCVLFNQPLNTWNTSSVKDMYHMFYKCKNFNQPLNSWDISRVKDMGFIFGECERFNQPLDKWNTSSVESMFGTFIGCNNFNQPLNSWDTSSVANMNSMFSSCNDFNQPLDKWNISLVRGMEEMFCSCVSFNQSLTSWILHSKTDIRRMFKGCGISQENAPVIKIKIKI